MSRGRVRERKGQAENNENNFSFFFEHKKNAIQNKKFKKIAQVDSNKHREKLSSEWLNLAFKTLYSIFAPNWLLLLIIFRGEKRCHKV